MYSVCVCARACVCVYSTKRGVSYRDVSQDLRLQLLSMWTASLKTIWPEMGDRHSTHVHTLTHPRALCFCPCFRPAKWAEFISFYIRRDKRKFWKFAACVLD